MERRKDTEKASERQTDIQRESRNGCYFWFIERAGCER